MHMQMHVTADADPFKPDEWTAYCQVNRYLLIGRDGGFLRSTRFGLTTKDADAVVHRPQLPLAKIGFFLHALFPASDVWRTVAVRMELLRSMLNVDRWASRT